MGGRDYIPRRETDLEPWARNFFGYVKAKYTSWGIPDPNLTLGSPIDEFAGFMELIKGERHNKGDLIAKNTWKKTLIKELRTYAQAYVAHNPKVTDEDRTRMGLPLKDIVPTHHDVVHERVQITRLEIRNSREIIVHFQTEGAANKAKPFGYAGAVFQWEVRDSAPTRPEDLTRHRRASRTPFTIHFDETERGRTVYVTAAWENGKSVLGEFCEVVSTLVP